VALYLVVEKFRNGDAAPVYRRFRERGRLAPDGLGYVSSWVTEDLSTCFQVMDAPDKSVLEEWMSRWADLVEFEVHAVMTSAQAAERVKD
jgi:Protein of unknown function (DUF3303)